MSFEEGFQTVGATGTPTPTPTQLACPTEALQSFPLTLNAFTATEELYTLVNDPLTIDFQWGTRSTPPKFLQDSNAIDEVGLATLTTFTYLGVKYQVNRVEIAKSTHAAWILPAENRASNREDFVITFEKMQSDSSARYRYIVFVIPIIRVEGSVNEPDYIRGLLNSSASGNFPLQSCFPTNANSVFAYYSICLNGVQDQYPIENAYVFVSTEGIRASSEAMTNILRAYNPSITEFPDANPPFKNRFIAANQRALRQGEFAQFVLSTSELLNARGGVKRYGTSAITSTAESRRDDLDAYKCVPLNPDANVEGTNIDIDVETGTPLKEVLAQREAEKNALGTAKEQGGASLNPGRLEKIMSSTIGIFMAVLASLGLLLLISRYFGPAEAAVAAGATAPQVLTMGAKVAQWAQSSVTYAIIIVLTGFLGFIIGVMLQ